MPPQLRELLNSANRLTVDSVSQTPFFLEWGDPRGPRFFYEQARAEGFTQLPVRQQRSTTRIVLSAELATLDDWRDSSIGRPIEVDDLVSRDAPLFSLLRRLQMRELLLCLGPDGVDGVVTIYDLNQPAAHMFTLGLALLIEGELANAITRSLSGDRRAVERHVISVLGQKYGAVKRWKHDVAADSQLEILSYLSFYDKCRCLTERAVQEIAQAADLDAEEARRQLREVKQIRNNIAHYDAFNLADYRTVGTRMAIAYRLARKLANLEPPPTAAAVP
jgi:hypothetical protein